MSKSDKDKIKAKYEKKLAKKQQELFFGAAHTATQLLMFSARDNVKSIMGYKDADISATFDNNPPGENVLWVGDIFVVAPSGKKCRVFNVIGHYDVEAQGVAVNFKWYPVEGKELN